MKKLIPRWVLVVILAAAVVPAIALAQVWEEPFRGPVTSIGLFPDGSAALPAISFASESCAGIWRAGANTIGIGTNGVTTSLSISHTAVGYGVALNMNNKHMYSASGPLELGANCTTGATGEVCVANEIFFGAGAVPAKVTADPCPGGFPEGAWFYNDTSDYYCFCDGAGDDLKVDGGTNCF